jgi:quercetin dioxygenase-like cupin family protein
MAMLPLLSTVLGWTFDDIVPDLTVHENVEVREVGLDSRGPHMTHVRMHGGLGAKIEGTIHNDEHEYVLVLTGEVEANIGGCLKQGGPGTIFNIPRGVVHGYRPLNGGLVEVLAIYAPVF